VELTVQARCYAGDMDAFGDVRQVRHDVSWAQLAAFLRRKGEAGVPRIAYLDGVLELVTPGWDHGRVQSYLGRLVETYALERGILLSPYGQWTQRSKVKRAGAEPDECYQIGKQTPHRRPDLVIEVMWSPPRVDKLEIYRRLGVREVWLWRRGRLEVHVLRGRTWHQVARSPSLPGLDLDLLMTFLDRPTVIEAMRDFRDVLRGGG
jgi:Uma2 family endonuclease